MLGVEKIREMAQTMAKGTEYKSRFWEGITYTTVLAKQAENTVEPTGDFTEIVTIDHKQLLMDAEGWVEWKLSQALGRLEDRTKRAFAECQEVEYIGESMYGAEVRGGEFNEVKVMFYSYSAGIKTVRERVTEERV